MLTAADQRVADNPAPAGHLREVSPHPSLADPQAVAQPPRRRSTDDEVILIVDDLPENLSVLGSLLQGAGYRVKVANAGDVALRLAEHAPRPSLILLDVMMPDMDGLEVLARLRADEATRDIPVILVTALVDDERVADGQAQLTQHAEVRLPLWDQRVAVRAGSLKKCRRCHFGSRRAAAKPVKRSPRPASSRL